MTKRTRHATASTGEDTYPSIVNQGYLSDYYLAYRLRDGLADFYRRWDDREKAGEPTARATLRTFSTPLARLRVRAAATGVDRPQTDDLLDSADDAPIELAAIAADAIAAQRELNEAVLGAFRWGSDDNELTMMVGEAAVTVPSISHRVTSSGLLLVALGTVFADDPANVAASKNAPAGTLLAPLRSGERIVARTVLEAAQLIFAADEAPSYILAVSGGAVTLLDRERWREGVFLGAKLDDAVARNDDRSKGELAAIAALFSADSIDPGDDAQSVLRSLIDRSTNESAGVSKELRHGIRRSVELLAAAVVDDIRTRQKKRWEDIDADEMTQQCLRYLYRIIVLLFAEARPELGILPVHDTDFQDGYSVARLRDVALVDLRSELSTHSTHIQQSLEVLFALVNDGYQPDNQLDDGRSLVFPGLKSALFGADACPMLDRAEISDTVFQQVLANLCFTPEQSGKQRQSLSYATLGINQLGAVYEGLMAYRGFLATEELFEVDDDDDADTGTWVIAASDADHFPDDVFVTEPGPDGTPRRVSYKPGDFVFRLASRDRQRSASFYTPEVLTEFTVRHALDVYEEEHPNMAAADWLALTVCEPALGSGAFANEAVNQLAARYLTAAQRERGEQIEPDRYQLELQRTKAHFAINRTYGVDLNGTAVELAEVSLWLNVMHDGLTAPRFDARLRQGNSLIGARRATYTRSQAAAAPWKGSKTNPVLPPADQPISAQPLGADVGIHHFLLPGEGWGCTANADELKGKGGKNPVVALAEDWSERVRDWSKRVRGKPSKQQLDRLVVLGRRVEHAWEQAAKDAAAHLAAHERRLDVWGADDEHLPRADQTSGSGAFARTDGPVARLRLLMDAWCSLWVWGPANGSALPSLDMWIDAAELLLGQPTQAETGELFTAYDLSDDSLDSVELFGKATIAEILERHPWLTECQQIAASQAFFHWELEFAPVFAKGGFDLQVGNPPWVRPDWIERETLAEFDPWWGIADLKKIPIAERTERRLTLLESADVRSRYANERSENAGLMAILSAEALEPLLNGLKTNLFLLFMTRTWSRSASGGVIGLIHPETHFVQAEGDEIRKQCYRKLRRHWQFVNEKKLFDRHNSVEFGVNIYGSDQQPHFKTAANLLEVATLDRSIGHDGTGEVPGAKFPDGEWDTRPHAKRIVTVDSDALSTWASLSTQDSTDTHSARLLRPLTSTDASLLTRFAEQPIVLSELDVNLTVGFDEGKLKSEGTARWETHIPERLGDLVLQGPHVTNATPLAQQPRENCKNNKDWEAIDLETLPVDFVPRSNYRYLLKPDEIERQLPTWDGLPYSAFYRLGFREWVNLTAAKTMHATIVPPGVATLGTIMNVRFQSPKQMVRTCGLLASIPYDWLVRVSGTEHLNQTVTSRFRFPGENDVVDAMIAVRILRLNCLTEAFAPLWSECYHEDWEGDRIVSGDSMAELGAVSQAWSEETPLRKDLDRWLAVCDLDALGALSLGLEVEQLCQIYRSQFGVLREREFKTVFDSLGRQISAERRNRGVLHAAWEANLKAQKLSRGEKKVGMWDRVQAYLAGDTDVDLGPFVPPFVPADREAAMSKAYQAFSERIAAT